MSAPAWPCVTVAKDRCGHVRQHEGAKHAVALFELESWPDGKVSARLEVPDARDPGEPFTPTVVMERVNKTLEDSERAAPAAVRYGTRRPAGRRSS